MLEMDKQARPYVVTVHIVDGRIRNEASVVEHSDLWLCLSNEDSRDESWVSMAAVTSVTIQPLD